MSKFIKDLERAALLFALGQNPMAMRYMSADEIRELLNYDYDKE